MQISKVHQIEAAALARGLAMLGDQVPCELTRTGPTKWWFRFWRGSRAFMGSGSTPAGAILDAMHLEGTRDESAQA